MKNIQQNSKRWAGILGMICLLAVLFTSCSKDKDYVVPPAALISVINASPGSTPLYFYLDKNLASNLPINYGNGLDYQRAYTGKRYAAFFSGNQKVKGDTIALQQDKFYSLYLTNTPGHEDFVFLNDSISRPAAGMSAMRLVNLSTDAGAIDLAIKGGAVLATNKNYKDYSKFVSIEGNKTDTLEVRKAGTSTVIASISNVKIRPNSIYTVWLQGLQSATDNTRLTAKLQLNVYY